MDILLLLNVFGKSSNKKYEIFVDTLMLSSSIVLFVVNKIDATVEVDRGMWNESISSNVFGVL